MPTRVLVPSGVLGLGFDVAALERGIAAKPDIICIDGGSTDSGPYYLGTGTSKYARDVCKAEWRHLMRARAVAGVPLVIGSCGTCGTNSTVDWMYDITVELAKELGQSLSVARLYADQSPNKIADACIAGRVVPLVPAPDIDADAIRGFSNIVALAGAEAISAALASGADIILAGRTTDTAIISALPIQNGDHAGAAWHGAKIAECGAFCSTNPGSGVILVEFDESGFTVEAMAEDAICTPHSVSAHMLYENVDPYILHEPGGHLDVTAAIYKAESNRRVRVEGSVWVPSDNYTVKLEAAKIAGYQTTMLAIIRDAHYVKHSDLWVERLTGFLQGKIAECTDLWSDDYSLEFRLIGVDATLGRHENRRPASDAMPVEVGVLLIITAPDQTIATDLSKLINPFLLHYPLDEHEDLPTFAFPYSPAHSDRGALYEFALNHVLALDQPMDAFTLSLSKIAGVADG
ncbi:MAG: acyclic terpene utilization AtuA family protein [Candidatus Puniceispirillum sp.]